MKPLTAVKTFFERLDDFAPTGGREVKTTELMELRKAVGVEGWTNFAKACADELGEPLELVTAA